MKKESVTIDKDASRKIQHDLSVLYMDASRNQEAISTWFIRHEFYGIRTAMFEHAFIDSAWSNGKVSYALGMMISNFSPETSN